MKKVLITGATGATGGNAIKRLLELKVPVRALVHKVDERSEKLSSQGVEIVRGDLSDFEAVSEALKGITAAYFVFPIKVPGILEATAFYPSLPDQLVDCGPGFRPVLLRRENFGLHHQEIIRALWHSSYRLENLQRVLPTLLRVQSLGIDIPMIQGQNS